VIKVINVVKISGLLHSFHWHERTTHRAELELGPKVSKSLSEQNGRRGFLKYLFEKKLCLAQLKNYVAEISGFSHSFHWNERTAQGAQLELGPKVSKSLPEQNGGLGFLKCLFEEKLCLAQIKNYVAENSGLPHPFHWHERTAHPAKCTLCPKDSKSHAEQNGQLGFLKCLLEEKLSQIYGDVPSRFFFETLKGCNFPTWGRGQAPKFFLLSRGPGVPTINI
jgi:hypothetical protein